MTIVTTDTEIQVVSNNEPDRIVVEEPEITVIVEHASVTVLENHDSELLVIRAPGERGPQGPPGPMSGTYVHVQTIPASVWTIQHGLGYDPGGVTVITSDGFLATEWALQYLQSGQSLRLSFDLAIAGSAALS